MGTPPFPQKNGVPTTLKHFHGSRDISNVTQHLGSRKHVSGLKIIRKLAENDPAPVVRSRAVWAAGAIGTARGRAIIEKALKDPDEAVRRTAVSMGLEHLQKQARIKTQP